MKSFVALSEFQVSTATTCRPTRQYFSRNRRRGLDPPSQPALPKRLPAGSSSSTRIFTGIVAGSGSIALPGSGRPVCGAVFAQADFLQVDSAVRGAAEVVRAIGVEQISLRSPRRGELHVPLPSRNSGTTSPGGSTNCCANPACGQNRTDSCAPVRLASTITSRTRRLMLQDHQQNRIARPAIAYGMAIARSALHSIRMDGT